MSSTYRRPRSPDSSRVARSARAPSLFLLSAVTRVWQQAVADSTTSEPPSECPATSVHLASEVHASRDHRRDTHNAEPPITTHSTVQSSPSSGRRTERSPAPFAGVATAVAHARPERRPEPQRTTPLVHTRDGDNIVIIASKGGAPSHPDWYRNLSANPQRDRGTARRDVSSAAHGSPTAKNVTGSTGHRPTSCPTSTSTRRRPTD